MLEADNDSLMCKALETNIYLDRGKGSQPTIPDLKFY